MSVSALIELTYNGLHKVKAAHFSFSSRFLLSYTQLQIVIFFIRYALLMRELGCAWIQKYEGCGKNVPLLLRVSEETVAHPARDIFRQGLRERLWVVHCF